MFGTVTFAPRSLEQYRPVIGEAAVDNIRRTVEPLRGVRVLHLSMAAYGTALADGLSVLVPLFQDLGVQAEWGTLRASDEFAGANREMYAALGGGDAPWGERSRETWRRFIATNADLVGDAYDIVVVHDPQALPIIERAREQSPRTRWLWRSHLDLSGARADVWAALAPSVADYDAITIDHIAFAPPNLARRDARIIAPGIDPLGPRCMDVDRATTEDVLRRYGLDPALPMLSQIGPLDEESDALGAIEVYDTIVDRIPGLQLLLVATHLDETSRTRAYYERVAEAVAARPGVTLLISDLHELGNVELNIFQRASAVVMHKSLRRGFGLWIAEAMWKARPVVAGRAGGLPLLVRDGETGYLVADTASASTRAAELLTDRALADDMGAAGREYIRRQFLITRVLRDELDVLRSVSGAETRT